MLEKIHNHFYAKTKAKFRYLRTELRNTRKGERSIVEFLTRIKTIVDSLLAIGQTVSVQEQIDVILEGLPSEYESLVTTIRSKIDQFKFEEI